MADSRLREYRMLWTLEARYNRSFQQAFKSARGDIQETKTGFDKFADSIEQTTYALQYSGLIDAVTALDKALIDTVKTAAEFEYSMSAIAALTDADAAALDTLTEKAKEIGMTTVYTAQQTSEAMQYMALAGWDTRDMLSGIDGVIRLAAASGEDLATVSGIVTDSLAAFGMQASDTAHFADILAATATNSNTTVSQMGQTFRNVASVAGALGYSAEDVATQIAVMANNGIKASKAGTSLRNIYTGLLEGVTLTGQAFGEYDFSAKRADGSMKSLGETMTELRSIFSQMTQAEQVQNAETIAGLRGFNALAALMKTSQEDYDDMANTIRNAAGAAKEMADVRMDNLKGDVIIMKSAWESLTIELGQQFTPAARDAVKLLTDIINYAHEFIRDNPGLVKGIAAAAGSITLVVGALSALTAGIKIYRAISATLNLTTPWGLALTAISAVVGVIVAATEANRQYNTEVKEATKAARDLNPAIQEAAENFEETGAESEAAAKMAGYYIDKLDELQGVMDSGELTAEEYTRVQREYKATIDLLTDAVPELSDLINAETGEIEGGTAALRRNTEEWVRNAKAQAAQEYFTEASKKYGAAALELEKNRILLEKAESNELIALNKEREDLRRAVTSGDYTDEMLERFIELSNMDWTGLAEAEHEVSVYAKAVKDGEEALDEATEGMKFAEEVFNDFMDTFGDGSEEQKEDFQDIADKMGDMVGQLDALEKAYQEAYTAAYKSLSGQFSLWDEVGEKSEQNVQSVSKNLKEQTDYWTEYNKNLESLISRKNEIDGIGEFLSAIADGGKDSAALIADMAGKSDDEIQELVKQWQENRKIIGDTSDTIANLTVDVNERMQDVVDTTAEQVEELDLGKEAYASAMKTLEGYIEGLGVSSPYLYKALFGVRRRIESILSDHAGERSGGPQMATQDWDVSAHYASGTESARHGLALVGENGPELVYMRGGEKVLNARDTAAAIGGGVQVNVSYTINGMADERALRDNSAQIERAVERALERHANEARRRVYR